jgi:hypothetical protein
MGFWALQAPYETGSRTMLSSLVLLHLTHNNISFVWSNKAQAAMDELKHAIISSPAIHPIDYSSGNDVILAVDSSHIACRWILIQLDNEGHCRPAHFGSITWNE